MAVYPLYYFTTTDTLVSFNERYKSSPLGKKCAGHPKGVYVGFEPSTAGSVLTLSPDVTRGYSLVKVPSREDPGGMDVLLTRSVDLDFVGQPDVDFPLLVVVRARYFDDPDRPTIASLVTRSGPVDNVQDDEVLVCVVNGPASTISAVNDSTLGEQDTPLAFSGKSFGYMPGGAIEDLQAAADIVNEVVAARLGLDGTNHADLSTRLAVDYGAASMAERLGLAFRALRSNDYSVAAGEESVVVSGSFSEVDRDFLPDINFNGEGSETTEGAVAGPFDATRNVVLVVDADTGYRLIDNATDRRIVYGRLVGPNEETVSGQWQFVNASDDVSTTDGAGQATIEMAVGDTIIGADGKHYEVESITDNNNIVLRTAYQGATASLPSTSKRRWEVQFKTMDTGLESDVTLDSARTVRFFFPAFVSRATGVADWSTALHTAAEREPLPAATTDVPGLVKLARSGALLGQIRVQNAGATLAGGPFHSLNFSAAEASVVTSTTPGEVIVEEIGPIGPTGPAGASGGPGPEGDPGPGYSELNPFEISQEFVNQFGTTNTYSFTRDMGHNIRYLHGGLARYRDRGSFGPNAEAIRILQIDTVSATEGFIEIEMSGTPAGDINAVLFLSSAGDL